MAYLLTLKIQGEQRHTLWTSWGKIKRLHILNNTRTHRCGVARTTLISNKLARCAKRKGIKWNVLLIFSKDTMEIIVWMSLQWCGFFSNVVIMIRRDQCNYNKTTIKQLQLKKKYQELFETLLRQRWFGSSRWCHKWFYNGVFFRWCKGSGAMLGQSSPLNTSYK